MVQRVKRRASANKLGVQRALPGHTPESMTELPLYDHADEWR
jgi:hypothetical protein